MRRGGEVRLFDSIDPQAHPDPPAAPAGATLARGSILDRRAFGDALRGASTVIHLAAMSGVGQSMYQPARYLETNVQGTANLLELAKDAGVKRIIVSGSVTGYGEGAIRCPRCGPVTPGDRSPDLLARGRWEPTCPRCGAEGAPMATPETYDGRPRSFYALSKRIQEDSIHLFGRHHGIATTSVRYFNVYGPGQSLSNPYTGVASIFLSRLRAGERPVVYEDGRQLRDFIAIEDAVDATVRALDDGGAVGRTFNVGSGEPTSVADLGLALASAMGAPLTLEITNAYRAGDIRHCYADVAAAHDALGFRARVRLDEGVGRLAAWARTAQARNSFDAANKELEARGLLIPGGR